MRKLVLGLLLGIAAIAAIATARGLGPDTGQASSHREAPLLAQDPMADNTDVYAFVSPDAADTVTLIANFIPFQKPDGGPNFYSFDPNVVYEIHVDNNGDAVEDITYQWRFTTEVRNPATFLYNTGPVTSLDDPDLNVRQFYRLTRIDGPRRTGTVTELSGRLPVPPPNIGPRSTPNYGALGGGVQSLSGNARVFAGQRDEGFYVDLGIFDLLGVGSGQVDLHHDSEEFHDRAMDHFRCLYAESAERAKIMAISCHPYLSGVPHRIAHVERTFADILGHDGVVAWTGEQLLDWYKTQRTDG